MEANSRMREITGNLRRDMKDLLGESAHIVTGFFKRGVCTVRAVADKWRTFTQDISAAVDELMKPPFLEGGPDAPLSTMEEGAEPIVTVTGIIDRNFPIGKQMPLSLANVYVAEMDAAYREEELPAQPVKVRIDYIRDGRTDCYCLPLHIGAGDSLLEQMERHLETYRADPNRVSALFQQAPEAYRLQLEEEFTPFVRESLEDLSQGTLQYFQRHCDISELEQQLQGQAAVLPESQRAPFEDKAAKTVFSLRRAANGAVPQEEHTDQTEQRAAHPVPASREAVPGEMTQPPQQAEGGESPQRSVKVKIRRLKQKQARRPQRPKVHLTPERWKAAPMKQQELYRYYSTQRPVDLGTYPKEPDNPLVGFLNYDDRISVEHGAYRTWGEVTYRAPLTTDQLIQYELQPSRDNPDVRETMKEQAQAVGQWEERNHIPFDRRLTQCIGIGVYTCKTRVTPAQLAERHRIAVDLPLVPRFRPKIKKPQQIEER